MRKPIHFFSWRFLILGLIFRYGLTCLLPAISWGQNLGEKGLVLGLPELIQMAISKSPEIGEIQSDIAGTKSDLEQVKAAYYPQLESTALVGPVQDAKLPQVVNGQITDPSPSLSLSSIGIFGRLDLTMTQPLYTFGKLSNRKEAASRGVRAKEFQVAEKKGQVVLKVKELYYALILARGGLAVANESQNFFEDAGKRIHNLLELGSPNVKESDLFRIDAYRADSIRFKAQAEKGVKVSYFALRSLIQLPPQVEFEPAERTLPAKREGLTALEI